MPAAPPTGTVTFLFTDIEGSTQHWEQHPDAMKPALARHDDLLRQRIEQQGGYVFKTVGDAFCAAFPTANTALEAALAAEPWETGTPLRVRMALHTGATEERGGDYFGQPLNRVARLMAAGHGGQVLLSEVTQGLVQDALPPNASLLDLNRHRLKDLGRPERVFQLRHPSLPADFPPLRSLDNMDLPNNLPPQVTSFIGREKEIREVKARLARSRLVTLTGAGGAGKTRLSLQVAADLLDEYRDGVWLVELAALTDPALVAQAAAQALGVREEAGRPLSQTLSEALRSQRLLLILDNCEHLVAACASLATDLLRACPHVHLLASSREALNVSGEQTYRVPSLSLPDPEQPQTLASLTQFEAVALFIERARAVSASFAVTDGNAPAVAQVCWHLDGIPLAIELAAARVRSLSVEEVNARLDNRFRLLTGGSRTALPRQQTLRALIDWSYGLLTEQEKTLLCRLSVFAGGWTLDAAEGVCSGAGVEDFEVLDLLTGLVDKSLVVYEEPGSDAGRYRLLETVRQYAADRLTESGGTDAVHTGHRDFFLSFAEEAAPLLRGAEARVWLSSLDKEHDNLRAALAWCEAETPSAEHTDAWLRLAGALWRFWEVRGHYAEGRQWLGTALTRAEEGPISAPQARALNGAGNLAWRQGDYRAARPLFEQSLEIMRRLGDSEGIAHALGNLGAVAWNQGNNEEARALYEQSLDIKRRIGDEVGTANALVNLGGVAYALSDYAGARALYEQSLDAFRRLGDQRGVACSLEGLACVAFEQGDNEAARALYEQSLSDYRQIGDQRGIACSLEGLADVAYAQGDYEAAHALHRQSLNDYRRIGDQRGIAGTLINLGAVVLKQGDTGAARAFLEQSLAIQREIGNQRGVADALEGLANAASADGDFEAARPLYVQNLNIKYEIGDKLGIAGALEGLAEAAASQGRYGRWTQL